MYYVDMLQNNNETSRGTVDAAPFISTEGTAVGGVVFDGKNLFVGEGENLFAAGLGGDPAEQYLNSGLSNKAVADTEENPIVIVRCSKLDLYKNQSVSVKFLYCGKDYMVAALIYGVCQFNGVPLQRCNTVNLNDLIVGRSITTEDLVTLSESCTDRESGYKYLHDCVFQLTMLSKDDGKGNASFKSSYVKAGEHIFTMSNIEAAREKKRKELEEAERRKKEKEAMLEQQRKDTERRRALEAEKEAERLAAKQAKKTIKVVGAKPKEEKVVCGAKDFLAAIAAIQEG